MTSTTLYVVATPIGNLDDITLRALRVLADVDLIAAEDTRHTRTLLLRHGIDTPLLALHEHNEERTAPRLVEKLLGGQSLALVSDAGTPLLSDPGYRLVKLAAQGGINITAVPGPSAVTAALSISGLATDRFQFEGFLPQKQQARKAMLESVRDETGTLVFFESSHRIEASLEDMKSVLGAERRAAICREMTKQFETVLRGTLSELCQLVGQDPNQRKGEFVIVLSGATPEYPEALGKAVTLAHQLLEYLSVSQAARVAARVHGVSRRELYHQLEGLQGRD
jgi:16S rRNA (cytidine1402-2'-O)-methyltransferase